jgi:hypothetical protein
VFRVPSDYKGKGVLEIRRRAIISSDVLYTKTAEGDGAA